ncbi:GrdX family protein [Brachyspira innocens]|uniref:GrdX family protein n=1 Tax=Brachyspira innocens TaxID=13264 RepID=A0ABT8YX76_9SPIR|nr:GrdX family protein [Brachyspira innocens]MDO6993585.1 GrdX family protein [Brachyspira innocens]MDO7019505.1 GrdX family protein [Brachyspira innocens]
MDVNINKKNILITNNPKFNEVNSNNIQIIYLPDLDFMGILYKARDYIHLCYKLLTHPIVSSIKPYETPYKSIALSNNNGELDLESLELIENSIALTMNFLDKPRRKLTETIDEDFKLIDYKLVSGAIESIL